MKNLNLSLFFLLLLSFSAYAQKKVAVVTFYVSKQIDFSELDGSAQLAGDIMTLANDPAFDLKPALDNFHKVFFEDLSKEFPFELVDESLVINNEQYKAYENVGTDSADEDKGMAQTYIVADGYKPLMERGKLSKDEVKAELDMLKFFPDADGVMFVFMDYSFEPKVAIGGNGTAGMKAFARLKLYNRNGDKVFAKNEIGTSKKSVGMVSGIPVMDPNKLIPLCNNATEKLLEDLKKKIGKLSSKVDKKL
ncbi:MAG: hypothetical protein MK086_12255 [Flavobacteriales bacterium]|nr:hypothetical protein [Flavobacteriales bacterium]